MKEIFEIVWNAPAADVLDALAKGVVGIAVAIMIILFFGFVVYAIAQWAKGNK